MTDVLQTATPSVQLKKAADTFTPSVYEYVPGGEESEERHEKTNWITQLVLRASYFGGGCCSSEEESLLTNVMLDSCKINVKNLIDC